MITKIEIVGHDLKVQFDFDTSTDDVQELMREVLKEHRATVFEFMRICQPTLDMIEYETGIDIWWGLGSVALWELGMIVTVEYTQEGVKLNINA